MSMLDLTDAKALSIFASCSLEDVSLNFNAGYVGIRYVILYKVPECPFRMHAVACATLNTPCPRLKRNSIRPGGE